MQVNLSHYYRKISDNIRKLRQSNNLSQEKFAEKLGCSREYISRLENYHEQISLQMLLTIAAVFELKPQKFFEE